MHGFKSAILAEWKNCQNGTFEALWKCHIQKIFISCSRVRQIQDLGHSKYKQRLFSKRTHGISRILSTQGSYESLASLESKIRRCPFFGIHNCKKNSVNRDGRRGGRFNDTCTEINYFSTDRHLNNSARGYNDDNDVWCFLMFTGWLELLWLPHRGPVLGRVAGRGCQGPVHAPILPSTPRLQTGQILEVSQRHPDNHGQHGGRAVQPDLRPMHHHIHICCDGHAALWQRLHR